MDDAVQAISMAFAVIVFVIALSISMMLIKQATTTAEVLVQYSDLTAFYDNIRLDKKELDKLGIEETERIVGLDTVIPTLYRYYKENFCVKIYDEAGELLQIFDVNLETNVRDAIVNTEATSGATAQEQIKAYAYKTIYNDKDKVYCLFGAPWLGSTENIKQRVDFFINGNAGYIKDTYVTYKSTATQKSFADIIAEKKNNDKEIKFKERFISYSYSGSTFTTDEGETLVNDSKNKDKIVIIYTFL